MSVRATVWALAASCLVTACSAAVQGNGSLASPVESSVAGGAASAGPSTVTVTASADTTPAAPAADFSALFAKQHSGVVRIETIGCSDSGVGTGFLVSPSEIVTVAHVVDQSVVVSLIDGAQATTGTVVGIDRSQDLALVRSDRPMSGFHFRLDPRLPAVGDEVAAIGFPLGDPITFTRGNISGLHRDIPIGGTVRTGLIETDAAINPGNSGGPLIAGDGTVVGLVDAKNVRASGIGYAVPASHAFARIPSWRLQGGIPPADCGNPLGPSQASTDVPLPAGISPAAASGVASTFTQYFDGINSGDYYSAWEALSPRIRGSSPLPLARGDATSFDFDVTVLDAGQIDATTVRVALAFTSIQRADKGPGGDTCDNWTLEYTVIRSGSGAWFIDDVQPYNGSTHTTC